MENDDGVGGDDDNDDDDDDGCSVEKEERSPCVTNT